MFAHEKILSVKTLNKLFVPKSRHCSLSHNMKYAKLQSISQYQLHYYEIC